VASDLEKSKQKIWRYHEISPPESYKYR